jgi:hypothetical protein
LAYCAAVTVFGFNEAAFTITSTLQHAKLIQGLLLAAQQQVASACMLFLPLQRGAGPMALMLWLDWVT